MTRERTLGNGWVQVTASNWARGGRLLSRQVKLVHRENGFLIVRALTNSGWDLYHDCQLVNSFNTRKDALAFADGMSNVREAQAQ